MENETLSNRNHADAAPAVPDKATPANTPAPLDPGDGIGLELQTENLIETYNVIAEWIRFADAKAGVVLTVGGAFAGLLIPTLKTFLAAREAASDWWVWLVVGLSSACLLFLGLAFLFAFFCLTPFRRKGRHPATETCPHFHAVGISGRYAIDQLQEFVQGYQNAKLGGFQRELLAAILIDSHISSRKYNNVTRSIRCIALATLFGLAYLIAAQFQV